MFNKKEKITYTTTIPATEDAVNVTWEYSNIDDLDYLTSYKGMVLGSSAAVSSMNVCGICHIVLEVGDRIAYIVTYIGGYGSLSTVPIHLACQHMEVQDA